MNVSFAACGIGRRAGGGTRAFEFRFHLIAHILLKIFDCGLLAGGEVELREDLLHHSHAATAAAVLALQAALSAGRAGRLG